MDKDHGCRPWRGHKVRKFMDPEKGMVEILDADGKICALCNNVYRIVGRPRISLGVWCCGS